MRRRLRHKPLLCRICGGPATADLRCTSCGKQGRVHLTQYFGGSPADPRKHFGGPQNVLSDPIIVHSPLLDAFPWSPEALRERTYFGDDGWVRVPTVIEEIKAG